MSDKPLTENKFLKAMEILQQGLSKSISENNKLIFDELWATEKRNKARHEVLMSATTLHKLEFVTRKEFTKFKKEISRRLSN